KAIRAPKGKRFDLRLWIAGFALRARRECGAPETNGRRSMTRRFPQPSSFSGGAALPAWIRRSREENMTRLGPLLIAFFVISQALRDVYLSQVFRSVDVFAVILATFPLMAAA